MFNKFAVLGEMEEAKAQKKEMLLNQYKLISSLSENCLQLEEDAEAKGVLQKQVEIMKLLQNGDLPSMPKKNLMETKLNHLLRIYDAIHKATTTATSSFSIPHSTDLSSPCTFSAEPKTYAQVTAHHPHVTLSTSKNAQTEKEVKKVPHKVERKQRLLVKVKKEAMQNFNNLQLRNLINNAFSRHNTTAKAVVADVFKSFSEQSIIITTMPKFSSDFLIQHKDIWQKSFSESINSDLQLKKNEKWGQFCSS